MYLGPQVEEFFLWPAQRVLETIATTDDFKSNCCLVNLDFFVRHGLLAPEHPGYLELLRKLRSGDCS